MASKNFNLGQPLTKISNSFPTPGQVSLYSYLWPSSVKSAFAKIQSAVERRCVAQHTSICAYSYHIVITLLSRKVFFP